jgi:hypothetical protein
MGFDKCHVESRRRKGQQSCKLFVEIERVFQPEWQVYLAGLKLRA